METTAQHAASRQVAAAKRPDTAGTWDESRPLASWGLSFWGVDNVRAHELTGWLSDGKDVNRIGGCWGAGAGAS